MIEAALKKDRNEGQHCQHSGREGELCQVGADVGWFAEVGKVKHRAALLALDENEKGEENHRAHAFTKDPWIGPAAVVSFDKRERRQEKPATETGHAGQIEVHGVGISGGLDDTDDQRDQSRADWKIDIEGPFPPET